MIKELYNKLEISLLKEDNSFKDYDRNHIFFEILNYCSTKTTEAEKMDMYYHFYSYQRIIEQGRNRKLKLADFWINRVKSVPLNHQSKESTEGMNSLLYPAIAFASYMKKDYEDALVQLEKTFACIDFLIEDGFKEGILMKIEQKLNEFRTLYNMKNDNALNVLTSTLNYIVSDTVSKDFVIPISEVSKTKNEEIGLFNYCFDSIFLKVYRNKEFMQSFENDFFLKLIENLPASYSSNFSFLHEPMEAFLAILRGNDQKFFERILQSNLLDDRLPGMMRFTFIATIVNHLKKTEVDVTPLHNAFRKYNRVNLKAPDIFASELLKNKQNEKQLA